MIDLCDQKRHNSCPQNMNNKRFDVENRPDNSKENAPAPLTTQEMFAASMAESKKQLAAMQEMFAASMAENQVLKQIVLSQNNQINNLDLKLTQLTEMVQSVIAGSAQAPIVDEPLAAVNGSLVSEELPPAKGSPVSEELLPVQPSAPGVELASDPQSTPQVAYAVPAEDVFVAQSLPSSNDSGGLQRSSPKVAVNFHSSP
jgi:hypothetical protein